MSPNADPFRRVPVWVRGVLARGGRIESRRAFPCAPQLFVRDCDGKPVTGELRPDALVVQVEQRGVGGKFVKGSPDTIDFTVTESGRSRLVPWARIPARSR
jgi:hypothetical protein